MIEILHLTLKQAEEAASLNPNDQQAAELVKSLRHMLDGLESKHNHDAA